MSRSKARVRITPIESGVRVFLTPSLVALLMEREATMQRLIAVLKNIADVERG